MKDRLQQILDYKTGGKQTPFAKMLGWTPQYLAKLLRGDNFGIQPVITLLSTFPEINARWLLLGDGQMPWVLLLVLAVMALAAVYRLCRKEVYQ